MEAETIKKILTIKKDIALTPQEMAKSLVVTFYPTENKNIDIKNFTAQLKNILLQLEVKVIPYDEVLVKLSLKERLKLKIPFFAKFGKKIKKGVAIIVEGESETKNLAMRHLINLRENPIITILSEPKGINKNSSYLQHMNASLDIFAYHMTNLAIIVNSSDWAIYSLNGSHPYFSKTNSFKECVLNELLPKISAPVMPPSLKDFIIEEEKFNIDDSFYKPYIEDLVIGGHLLEKTGLYPKKRLVSELNFRNNFYKIIGSKYLDKRNGMSYGFVARQLPFTLSNVILLQDAVNFFGLKREEIEEKEIVFHNESIFVKFKLLEKYFFIRVPDVWVLTSKSGADKSNLNKYQDIVKMGLVNGKMIIQTPKGVDISNDYKPSFDTRVIFAHAVGNAILSSIINYLRPDWQYANILKINGCAIVHWHGYVTDNSFSEKMIVYGISNPSVSCSSAQSAIYALNDKIKSGLDLIEKNIEFWGDIHIEPHHGVNIIYKSVASLANKIILDTNISKLE